jgi:hypothetical protein
MHIYEMCMIRLRIRYLIALTANRSTGVNRCQVSTCVNRCQQVSTCVNRCQRVSGCHMSNQVQNTIQCMHIYEMCMIHLKITWYENVRVSSKHHTVHAYIRNVHDSSKNRIVI